MRSGDSWINQCTLKRSAAATFGVATSTWDNSAHLTPLYTPQVCSLLRVYGPVYPLWPSNKQLDWTITKYHSDSNKLIPNVQMGSITQRRVNPSLRTPPATLARAFTHGHLASGKVGNYAELCRGPKILSHIRGSPLPCPSTQTPRRCHYLIILPSASVSVAGWAALGSIACPAVTRYQVSASPSSRSLSLALSTPSLYSTPSVVTPSKRRPSHYS